MPNKVAKIAIDKEAIKKFTELTTANIELIFIGYSLKTNKIDANITKTIWIITKRYENKPEYPTKTPRLQIELIQGTIIKTVLKIPT